MCQCEFVIFIIPFCLLLFIYAQVLFCIFMPDTLAQSGAKSLKFYRPDEERECVSGIGCIFCHTLHTNNLASWPSHHHRIFTLRGSFPEGCGPNTFGTRCVFVCNQIFLMRFPFSYQFVVFFLVILSPKTVLLSPISK